ncbi:hypothetical protein [Tatumella ptyseos]|uniref:hypothetical protein n=1 Tax=Tatumella ptyseos TaxID=82987 RepID=UPI0026EDB0B8|nr:hypothetical protein [Tatumella ptyseos]WKX27351.1 hypothetical protein QJR74_04190 [Tatumella ptyseos]
MKLKELIDRFVIFFINNSFHLIIKLTKNLPLKGVMSVLYIYGGCFLAHFRKQFRSDSAKFHAIEICQIPSNKFILEHIRNQLFSQYLRRYLFFYPKSKCERFVQRNIECLVEKPNAIAVKLYLCTHSGDYWLTILNIAYQYRNNSSSIKQLIVPIYELITETNREVFAKIEIPGFEVIFIHIHEPGALKKIMAYLRDDISAVAIFYDLFCYAAGTLNGAVENVLFFDRQAYMTTGFSSLIVRFNLPTVFVSTHYCARNGKFITSLSSVKYFDNVKVLREEMVSYIEEYIKKYPTQWHFISHLDTFYHYPFIQLKNSQENKISTYLRLQHKYFA